MSSNVIRHKKQKVTKVPNTLSSTNINIILTSAAGFAHKGIKETTPDKVVVIKREARLRL